MLNRFIGKHVEIYLLHPRLEKALEAHCLLGTLKSAAVDVGFLLEEISDYSCREIFIPYDEVHYVSLPKEPDEDDA